MYACVHAGEFPLQALLRLRPRLRRRRKIAVLEGLAPLERVCAADASARTEGVMNGMTRVQAESFPGLAVLQRNMREEQAARTVLWSAAARYTPAVEDASTPLGAVCVLDLAGTERLWGSPEKVANRLVHELAQMRLEASAVVSRNFHTACLLARNVAGVITIEPGKEAEALAPLLLPALPMLEEQQETLALWGIHTLGGLAALPERDLVVRLGQEARRLRAMARGEEPHLFQPMPTKWALEERFEFDGGPISEMDSLLFVFGPMVDQLLLRAGERAMAVAELVMRLELERGGGVYERRIRPAIPSRDRKLLLKLLQLDLAAHPPARAVVGVVLHAEPGEIHGVQLSMYAPPTPEPSRLDVTLARLRALVGEERVGWARLLDTHKRDSWRVESFVLGCGTPALDADRSAPSHATGEALPVVRRLRPPVPVVMGLEARQPARFAWSGCDWEVVRATGPWKASGSWWNGEEAWAEQEWELLVREAGASDLGRAAWQTNGREVRTLCCRVVGARGRWWLESVYD